MQAPTLSAVRAAEARVAPHVRRTPSIAWAPRADLPLTLKLEYLQVGGSFKARGACNRLFAAADGEVSHGAVTASGGNHGIGVAYAAARRGVPAKVYLPELAPSNTEARLGRHGAIATRIGRTWDDAWEAALADAARSGALPVHPFEDEEVIAGQATLAAELLADRPQLDLVVVAVGGGGLIGGIAAGLRALGSSARVVGVEPEGAPSLLRSLEADRVVTLPEVRTIAGTLAPRAVGPRTLALARAFVAEVVLVSDDELRAAMRLLWEELRVLVEPAGAATVAALVSGRVELRGARSVTAVVCGANVDPTLAAQVVAG